MTAPADPERSFVPWFLEQTTTLVLDCAMLDIRLPVESMSRVTVGVIDSHRFCRETLAQVLAAISPEPAVPTFSDVAEFLSAPRPDLDLLIYRAHGSELPELIDEELGRLNLAHAGIPVVILSDIVEPLPIERVRQAMQQGVRCFLSARTTTMSVMLAVLPLVRAGGVVGSLHMMPRDQRRMPLPPTPNLTRRQAAVFDGLSRGQHNEAIAADMNISESAVASHVRNIMRALGAATRAEAVQLARLRARGSLDGGRPNAEPTDRRCVPA